MKKHLQFSKESEEILSISQEEEFSRINSYNISYTTQTLIELIQHQELELEPEFQRNFVWDKRRASLFIDSLLIGFPTPSLFFGKNTCKQDFIVIDGLQRLKTIYFYITGDFYDGNGFGDFKLSGLSDRSWNRQSFAQLPQSCQRRIRNSVINVTVIEDIDFKPEVVHEIFYRINTGGVPLTNQEVRNCVYSGTFNRQLHNLNRNSNWRTLLGSEEPDKRLNDVELVLRFFALIDRGNEYRAPMREFLSRYQCEMMQTESQELADLFEHTVSIIIKYIGENAFRKNQLINRALVETLMVAIATLLREGRLPSDIKFNYGVFLEELKYSPGWNGSGINSDSALRFRIEHAVNLLGD